MDETVTCLVRGPASRYPRGFRLLIPLWFAILGLGFLIADRAAGSGFPPPLWFLAAEVGGLFIAACTALFVLSMTRKPAFHADRQGVRIGLVPRRGPVRRRMVYLPWQAIAQIRLVRRRYGALMEITLSPSAPIVYRPSPESQFGLWLAMLIVPFWLGRGQPALTIPRLHPPRYRLKVCSAAADVVSALSVVAPETVPVRVVRNRAALRFSPLPPLPTTPAAPVHDHGNLLQL